MRQIFYHKPPSEIYIDFPDDVCMLCGNPASEGVDWFPPYRQKIYYCADHLHDARIIADRIGFFRRAHDTQLVVKELVGVISTILGILVLFLLISIKKPDGGIQSALNTLIFVLGIWLVYRIGVWLVQGSYEVWFRPSAGKRIQKKLDRKRSELISSGVGYLVDEGYFETSTATKIKLELKYMGLSKVDIENRFGSYITYNLLFVNDQAASKFVEFSGEMGNKAEMSNHELTQHQIYYLIHKDDIEMPAVDRAIATRFNFEASLRKFSILYQELGRFAVRNDNLHTKLPSQPS